MSKQLASRRFIYEIDSTRLKLAKWSYSTTLEETKRNGQVIPIFEGDVVRKIRRMKKKDFTTEDINQLKKEIKQIKRDINNAENRKKIKKMNNKLDEMMLLPEYMCVVVKNKSDYDYLSKHGFYFNGNHFSELLGSPNGIKKNKVLFVDSGIHKALTKQLNNGRNVNIPFVPAKLQAYLSLSCSNSTPVTNTKNILVVPDNISKFKTKVTLIDDTVETDNNEPLLIDNYEIEKEFESSDGQGLITPELMKQWQKDLQVNYLPSGVCIRHAFTKGMLFPFDFHKFAEEVAHNHIVKDVWGKEHDIRNIDVILTTSMLKLWKCYDSIDHYLSCCEENFFEFSVTKVAPGILENERRLNYQFIQALDLNDEDINKLTQPMINELQDVLGMDCDKTILFLGGKSLGERFMPSMEDKVVASLMLNQDVIKDGYVRNLVHKMIKKKIDETKYGKIKVRGNFQIIADDPYILCESIFGLDNKGLLKSGEFYSNYWNELGINIVAAFRAPMSCQSNARRFNLVCNEKMKEWYKYMKNVFILNSWDATCDALNGADKDGDMIMTTDNEIIVKGVKVLNPICCVQKNAPKKKVTAIDMREANKKGFGNDVGGITNKVTSMYERLADFEVDSEEYKTLMYRIQCGQNYQQNSIDKCKGIVAKDMPKYWYDYKEAKKYDDVYNQSLNQDIVANKKPYFMCYIYPALMTSYKSYIKNTNKNCLMRFGVDVDTLLSKKDKTEEELEYIKYYKNKIPVGIAPCIMNKIAWKVEDSFKDIRTNLKDYDFDKSIYMTDTKIIKANKKKIKVLLDKFQKTVAQFMKNSNREKLDKETKRDKFNEFISTFKNEAFTICSNEEELCNTLIEACYDDIKARSFIWNIIGEQILKNLINNNSSKIYYPEIDPNGEVTFNGEKYNFTTRELKEEEVNAINS